MFKNKKGKLAVPLKRDIYRYNKFYTGGPNKENKSVTTKAFNPNEKKALDTIYALFLGRKARKQVK